MKVLHVTSNLTGGAGTAANRLHRALRGLGVHSRMLVGEAELDQWDVKGKAGTTGRLRAKLRGWLSELPQRLYPESERSKSFSVNFLPTTTIQHINRLDPDVVHLHWINEEFLRIEEVQRIRAPIVWTFHDMWPVTGGCHYSYGCEAYTEACGQCPHLGSSRARDLSRSVHKRKASTWSQVDIRAITPSTWLEKCVRRSSIGRHLSVRTIHNGLDLDVFSDRTGDDSNTETKSVLFGAERVEHPRKGMRKLLEALRVYRQMDDAGELHIRVFGSRTDPASLRDLPFDVESLGYISSEEALAEVYSRADVMIVPSLQDNLPQTAVESMACGTPVLAFRTGGLSDIVDHKENGFLAEPFDPEQLARGLRWVLHARHTSSLSERARASAEKRFDHKTQAKSVKQVYEQALG